MSKNLSLRRNRLSPIIRKLVQEVTLDVGKMIQPLFVVEGSKTRQKVTGLGETHRDTPDSLLRQIEQDLKVGVKSFLLFGVPAKKKIQFEFTAKQILQIKKRFGSDLFLAVDVCLCSFTPSGQCGILNDHGDHVMNAPTVEKLAQAALAYAQAGADCVAPSDMMDGRIAAIRESLDRRHFEKTILMSYSAKFHSKFYGPFRLAADSAPKGASLKANALKDRATYQIDPANFKDALASSQRDLAEGADWLMVKPGLPYLDVLYRLSQAIHCPWAVYEVSGEYASIEVLAREGLVDGPRAHLESWKAFRRAGTQMIISYGSRHAQNWIKEFES